MLLAANTVMLLEPGNLHRSASRADRLSRQRDQRAPCNGVVHVDWRLAIAHHALDELQNGEEVTAVVVGTRRYIGLASPQGVFVIGGIIPQGVPFSFDPAPRRAKSGRAA